MPVVQYDATEWLDAEAGIEAMVAEMPDLGDGAGQRGLVLPFLDKVASVFIDIVDRS